jgi:acetoin:2,6-dichlorophenolindophenol oxidoreductase subunit alpha
MNPTRSDLLNAYRIMSLIRAFEERLHVEFATGEIPGFVHLYAGEEAIAAGVCLVLDERDKVASTHRGHGHSLAKGCDAYRMMAEIFGRKDGLCAGKGGSMHIADLSKGMLGANGIVAGGPPLACGAALAAQKLGTGGVAVGFVGDGGANQGTFLESLNLAAIWSLPCIFVVENNGYAEATSCRYAGACLDFADRANGFGMPGVIVDGHDFFAVYETASEAVQRARSGKGPSLIECKVSRYYGHYEGDTQSYRAPNEVEKIRETKDCIRNFTSRVISAGLLNKSELEIMDQEAAALIEDSVKKAKSAPKPVQTDLLTDVYISY